MGEIRESLKSVYRQPWFYSVLLLSMVPFFPDYVSFVLVLLSFGCAVVDARRREAKVSFGRFGFMLAAYIGYMAFSLIYSIDFAGSFWSTVMWTVMFLGYLAMATVLIDRHRLRIATLCLTGVTGAVGLVSMVQYICRSYFGVYVNDQLWEDVDKIVYGFLNIPTSAWDFGYRVSGTFSNPNIVAAYLIMTIPFCMGYVLTGTSSKPKALARIALVLSAYGVGFSFSRGGYLALLVIGACLVVFHARKKFVMTVLAAIYIMMLVPPAVGQRMATVVPENPSLPADSLMNTEVEESPENLEDFITQMEQNASDKYAGDHSVQMRFAIWGETMRAVLKRPLLGYGAGTAVSEKILVAGGYQYRHTHNLVFEILLQGGVMGLVLAGGILALVVIRGWRLLHHRKNSEAWWLGFATFGFIAAMCIHGLVDYPLLTPRLICTVMLSLGIIESAGRVYLHSPVPEPRDIVKKLLGKE